MQTIQVQFDLNVPEESVIPEGYDFQTAHVAYMYEHGILSAGQAAQALNVPVREVVDYLAPYGVAAANMANIDTYVNSLQ